MLYKSTIKAENSGLCIYSSSVNLQYARLAKTIKLSAVAVAARRPPKQAVAAPVGAKKVTEDEIAAEFAGLGVGNAADEETA